MFMRYSYRVCQGGLPPPMTAISEACNGVKYWSFLTFLRAKNANKIAIFIGWTHRSIRKNAYCIAGIDGYAYTITWKRFQGLRGLWGKFLRSKDHV